MLYSTTYASPMGTITLASNGEALTGLWLEGQKYFAATATGDITENASLPVFASAKAWLDKYFAGEKPTPEELPLCPDGSAFRQDVWAILCKIPYGEVVTYGDIAKKLAAKTGRKSMSCQAVGGAVGHNPLSIIVPCHRVVGAGGNLTGYAGGLATKVRLLQHEGADMTGLYIPKKGTAL